MSGAMSGYSLCVLDVAEDQSSPIRRDYCKGLMKRCYIFCLGLRMTWWICDHAHLGKPFHQK